MSRSEYLRRVLEDHTDVRDTSLLNDSHVSTIASPLIESDLSAVLQSYWQCRQASQTKYAIVGLGIVTGFDGTVLIASRQHDDTSRHLTWGFPGGTLRTLDFAYDVRQLILGRTGCQVDVGNLLSTRVFPDTTALNTRVVVLYFDCRLVAKDPAALYDRRYDDIQWVAPQEVFRHFTTSVSDDITHHLQQLDSTPY